MRHSLSVRPFFQQLEQPFLDRVGLVRPLYGLELERGFVVCQARADMCRDGFVRWDAVTPTYDDGRVDGVRLSWKKSCVEQISWIGFRSSRPRGLRSYTAWHIWHELASLLRRVVGHHDTD